MTKIITTAVIKGGTGKTTTTAALTQAAALNGKKVLAVDMDPQGNLTMMLGATPSSATIYDVIQGMPITEAIQSSELANIDIIAASPNLATISTKSGSGMRLHDAIQDIRRKYDFIFIDTPPQMNELTFMGLQACTGLIIPLEADTGSLQGLYQIVDIANQIRKNNTKMRILGVIITRYDAKPKLNRYMHEVITSKCKALHVPYLCTIRTGIAVKEATAMQESLFLHAPKSKPAQDYIFAYDLIAGNSSK